MNRIERAALAEMRIEAELFPSTHRADESLRMMESGSFFSRKVQENDYHRNFRTYDVLPQHRRLPANDTGSPDFGRMSAV